MNESRDDASAREQRDPQPSAPSMPPSVWLRLRQWAGVDRAVFYAVLLRAWQLPAGLVSALLITRFFTPEVQGYYYTFASLVAMQTFFELSLILVVVNVSSHEWSRLRLEANGRPAGEPRSLARLASFSRQLALWYGATALLFTVCVGAIGIAFLDQPQEDGVDWLAPWLTVVTLHGFLLWCLPFQGMLEGCNQVATVNRYRLFQALAANIVVWICLASGASLWTAAGAAGTRLIVELVLLAGKYRNFFVTFWRERRGPAMSWPREVWPMQWRLALTGMFTFFAYFVFTPVLFRFQGAAAAGRMGMTWAIFMAIQAASLAWVQTRVPRFGMFIAEKRYPELDKLFFRSVRRSMAALLLAAAGVELLLVALHASEAKLATRVLDPTTSAIFLIALLVYQVPSCLAVYLRAHKREPLVVANILFCVLVGITAWWGGREHGARGIAVGYLLVISCQLLPHYAWIWHRCRRRWHQADVSAVD